MDRPLPDDAQAILAVERGAFERWAKGDLSGFLDASDDEVDYFDPFLEARLDGLPALRALYDKALEKVVVDRWEMVNPRVVVAGDMGVLTFNFVSQVKGRTVRWNTTERINTCKYKERKIKVRPQSHSFKPRLPRGAGQTAGRTSTLPLLPPDAAR
jgi:hypothetical protein